ncbi:hypothetical protein [Chlamydia buteonis]|uniref:hypothetical protein n=1 Tax=Chlamydia buteonis TaxID=2494525 RepID=UPI00344E5947
MSDEKISSGNNPLPPQQLFNLNPKQRFPVKSYLNRVLYNPNTRETTRKVLAIIGGLALAGGIACGITLGVLGAPGLVIATAIGVTLGTILLGASIALLPNKMKKDIRGKIKNVLEANRSYDFLSTDLANSLKANFKESSSLPKNMQAPGVEDIDVFTAKNNAQVKLVTFTTPSFLSSITDHGKGVSRVCFIPPEANLTHPKTIRNGSLDLFKIEIGNRGWNTNLAEFAKTPKTPAGWSRSSWSDIAESSTDDSPQYLISVWNPFGNYPKTANEQLEHTRHPLYGRKSFDSQKEMFVRFFKSLVASGVHSISIYGNDLLFPKNHLDAPYIDIFAPLDSDFESRVATALSSALAEIARDSKSNLTVCLYGIGGNPLHKPKPLSHNQSDIDDFEEDN